MDWQGVEAYVFEKMRKTHLPGLSIAAVKDGEVVYARGFGFRDVESGAVCKSIGCATVKTHCMS